MTNGQGENAWKGDPNLPTTQQGLKILGTPLGHIDYITEMIQELSREHQRFLDRIPEIEDLQAAWLLLSFCAASRANFYLRTLSPDHSRSFAVSHDANIWNCLSRMLIIGPDDAVQSNSQAISQLPLRLGGLGLRCATRTAIPAFWASWADSLHMIQQRHPE